MYLLSKKSLWLSDGSMGFGQESDVAFAEGIISQGGHLLCLPMHLLGFALLGSCLRGEIVTPAMVMRISLGLCHSDRDGVGPLKLYVCYWMVFLLGK